MRSTRITFAASAAGLLAVVGCQPFGSTGSKTPATPSLSAKNVERTIDDKFPQQLSGLSVGPAHCPRDVEPDESQPATCTITVEGQPVKVSVTRQGDRSFDVALAQAVVSLSDLEVSIEHKLGQHYSVSCGSAAVRVLDPPGTLTCTATGGHRRAQLDVTIQDTSGKYSFQEHGQ